MLGSRCSICVFGVAAAVSATSHYHRCRHHHLTRSLKFSFGFVRTMRCDAMSGGTHRLCRHTIANVGTITTERSMFGCGTQCWCFFLFLLRFVQNLHEWEMNIPSNGEGKISILNIIKVDKMRYSFRVSVCVWELWRACAATIPFGSEKMHGKKFVMARWTHRWRRIHGS